MKHTKAKIREALKGKAPCPNVKAGARRQHQWSDSKDENSDPVSDTIALINWEDGDIIIDHICNEAGGYFIGASEITERSKCLHSIVAKVFSAMSNSVSTVVESAEDHIITDKEREAIKNSFNEFMKVGEQLLNEVDKGMWQ